MLETSLIIYGDKFQELIVSTGRHTIKLGANAA